MHGPPISRTIGRKPMPVLLACLVATAVALLNSFQLQRNWALFGADVRYGWLLGGELAEAAVWVAGFFAIVAVDRRWGLQAGRGLRGLPAHLLLLCFLFFVQNGIMTVFTQIVDPRSATVSYWEAFLIRAGFKFPSAMVIYGILLGGVYAWELARQRNRGAVERANLRAELADVKLQQLRDQIHPHFLFNTLHLIGSLVREGDKEQAVETIAQLSELLRRALHESDQPLVTVRDELEFLERYISIQQLRFGPRLSFDLECEARLEEALVPGLLLQPLVENAITHGLDLERTRGRISVRASRADNEELLLEVEDNGNGYGAGVQDGIGLSNIRSRLLHLYGARQELRILPLEAGTLVRIRIPLVERRVEQVAPKRAVVAEPL